MSRFAKTQAPKRPALEALIEQARRLAAPSPRELWEQRLSFAYGNAAMSNDRITRDMVEALMVEIYGPRPEA